MICKNCGHKIIETKTYNGYEHACVCELGSHLVCTYTGDEDQYDECECEKPEPEQAKKQVGWKMIGEKEIGCTICNKTMGQIFIDHIQEHLNKGEAKKQASDEK